MPLQIRRGTDIQRQAITPAAGELIFVTNTNQLYVGNGVTPGGILATGYTNNDAQDAAAAIFTANNPAHSSINFAYNTSTNLITAAVDLSDYQGVIRANAFKGSVFADDGSTVGGTELVNAVDGSINLNGTVKGHIVPDVNVAYDLGSTSLRFRDLYLSGSSIELGAATITSTGSAVNLPSGSTINGVLISDIESGVAAGSDYNINIVGDDSSSIINSSTRTVTASGGFFGNLTGDVAGNITGVVTGTAGSTLIGNITGDTTGIHFGNVTGNVTGDVVGNLFGNVLGDIRGSVFSDNSTLLINGIDGNISNGNILLDQARISNIAGIMDFDSESDRTYRFTFIGAEPNPAEGLGTYSILSAIDDYKLFEYRTFPPQGKTDFDAGDISALIKFNFESISNTTRELAPMFIGAQLDPNAFSGTYAGTKFFVQVFPEFTINGLSSEDILTSMRYLTFDSRGRLGVNKENATATLDVNGNAVITGGLRADVTGSLFSDASTMIIDGTDGKLMVANVNLIGETGSVPGDTGSVDSWLEVTVNGATKYIPLYD